MSDELRAACEQWLQDQAWERYAEIPSYFTDALLRFVQQREQQREAATWRKAATWARGIRAPLAEQLRFGEDMAKQFEAKAQELTP